MRSLQLREAKGFAQSHTAVKYEPESEPRLSESRCWAFVTPLCWELEDSCFCGLGQAGMNPWTACGHWECGCGGRLLETASDGGREHARETDRRCLLHPLGIWARALQGAHGKNF